MPRPTTESGRHSLDLPSAPALQVCGLRAGAGRQAEGGRRKGKGCLVPHPVAPSPPSTTTRVRVTGDTLMGGCTSAIKFSHNRLL